jgi:predicted DNA binding CopG/RHH family protein
MTNTNISVADKSTNLRLPVSMFNEIKHISNTTGISFTEFTRRALRVYVDEYARTGNLPPSMQKNTVG